MEVGPQMLCIPRDLVLQWLPGEEPAGNGWTQCGGDGGRNGGPEPCHRRQEPPGWLSGASSVRGTRHRTWGRRGSLAGEERIPSRDFRSRRPRARCPGPTAHTRPLTTADEGPRFRFRVALLRLMARRAHPLRPPVVASAVAAASGSNYLTSHPSQECWEVTGARVRTRHKPGRRRDACAPAPGSLQSGKVLPVQVPPERAEHLWTPPGPWRAQPFCRTPISETRGSNLAGRVAAGSHHDWVSSWPLPRPEPLCPAASPQGCPAAPPPPLTSVP